MLWPGGFSWCQSLFCFGSCYNQNQSKCRNPHADPNPNKPLLQRESSWYGRPPDSASRGTQRQGQTQKHQFPCIESFRKQSSPQPCPKPLPQRRRMRQCTPTSNTAPRASCSQGYHGPCAARHNPQRYLFGLLGYPDPFLRERGLPYYPKSEGDGTSGNHSQCIRHRQLLGTGMVSPTYAYAAPSSHQGAADNYRNTRDKRIHAQKNPNIPIRTALHRILPSNETANY